MTERSLTSRDFPVHWPVLTRWTDNDMFGHLNNAVYYELFDTAINAWINTSTDVDPVTAPWLGVVAESGCRYFAELDVPRPARRRAGGDPARHAAASPIGWRSSRLTASRDAATPGGRGRPLGTRVRGPRRSVGRSPIPDAIRTLLATARSGVAAGARAGSFGAASGDGRVADRRLTRGRSPGVDGEFADAVARSRHPSDAGTWSRDGRDPRLRGAEAPYLWRRRPLDA